MCELGTGLGLSNLVQEHQVSEVVYIKEGGGGGEGEAGRGGREGVEAAA